MLAPAAQKLAGDEEVVDADENKKVGEGEGVNAKPKKRIRIDTRHEPVRCYVPIELGILSGCR